MPDREITEEQLRSVRDWIYDTKGGRFVRNLFPGGNGIFVVDGEPVVIYSEDKVTAEAPFEVYGSATRLLISDRHAQELDAAGIISFSGELQQGTETP